jgi:hypothetical protein
MIKFSFYVFLFSILAYPIFAGPETEEINTIKMTELKKVGNWFKDKKLQPRTRVLILEKLNILLLENSVSINTHSSDIMTALTEITSSNRSIDSSYSIILKKKTCLILSYLNHSNKELEAYSLLKSEILNENDGEVASACIRVISEFDSQKEDLNKMALKILGDSLKKKKYDDEAVEIALASIDLLNKYRMKQSYLTLLKILDSKYPTEVKNMAKKTLENIPQ